MQKERKVERLTIGVANEEVLTAYRKFKSLIYNENYSLPFRLQLAKYEASGIENKLRILANSISSRDEKYFEGKIERISFACYPKQLRGEEENKFEGVFFSNKRSSEAYSCPRITTFIECPIELHIISVLWVMRIGHKLDKELADSCFANRLHRNVDKDFYGKGIRLFQKYFERYSSWRNETISKAKALHHQRHNTAILNLDLKDFYHSVDFDVSNEIPTEEGSFDGWLNEKLGKIHQKYADCLFDAGIISNTKLILPIGLVSSSILANHYLKDFDQCIEDFVNPYFYGRYVDDIMLVFKSPSDLEKQKDPVASFVKRFIKHPLDNSEGCLKIEEEETEENSEDTIFRIDYKGNKLIFQQSKVKLFNFQKDEPLSLLEEFEENIRKNSSEFRMLPEEDSLMDSFDKASSHISYSDSINKIRAIEGFRYDRLQASKHLSFLINSSKNTHAFNDGKIGKVCRNIEEFFRGVNCIDLNGMWEKVFTFFIINRQYEKAIDFTKSIISEVEKIRYVPKGEHEAETSEQISKWVRRDLLFQLFNSLAMVATLDLKAFEENVIGILEEDFKEHTGYASILLKRQLGLVARKAERLIESNMLRHNYISYPLLNYCVAGESVEKQRINFLDSNINLKFQPKLENGESLKIRFSPRFIHYHEVCLFYAFTKLNQEWTGPFYEEEINIEYWSLNRSIQEGSEVFPSSTVEKGNIKTTIDKIEVELQAEDESVDKFLVGFPQHQKGSENENIKDEDFKIITLGKRPGKGMLRVAMANIKVNPSNSTNSFLGKPNISFSRQLDLSCVLNEAIRTKSDMVIFPEISVPFSWLGNITEFVRKSNIALVCGLEHISSLDGRVFNYVATILPFKHGKYRNAFVDLRLKRDYSHEEEKLIKGHKGFSVPDLEERKRHRLRVYDWNGICFSVFNCFEFSDIGKRAPLKGNVDFVVVVEYNRDTPYFSNISESAARDIHSYVIQVNDSTWGDSRIVRPSKSEIKDLVRIKGGEHVHIVTGEINIKELREFQMKEYSLQEGSQSFKPTPPGFSISKERRPW